LLRMLHINAPKANHFSPAIQSGFCASAAVSQGWLKRYMDNDECS
jgi:hypothetical protein